MADQSRYVGDFRDGERSGVGTLTSPDGVYRGQWQQGVPDGEGIFEGADGAHYDGGWREGRQSGFGLAEGPPGLVYEGTWVRGQKQGFGREVRPDGSAYEGDWLEGKRHGQGRATFADGTVHDGTWELNQPLGPGHRKDPLGIEITGSWNRDAVSSGLLRLPSGLEYAGPLYSRGGTVASPPLLDWLERAAGAGDRHARLLLGTAYLDLHRPAPDLGTARRWLGMAAQAGLGEARYRLALTYRGIDDARAVDLLTPAAAQGHAGANELLGDYLASGTAVPRDLGRAIDHYERAVAAGSSRARNNLAWLLATAGDVRFRDGARAVALIEPIALYLGDWQYLDTLAAARAAAGDFEQAVAAARQAVEAASLDPGVAPDELAALKRRLLRFRDRQPLVDGL
jgi:hypothetical protein